MSISNPDSTYNISFYRELLFQFGYNLRKTESNRYKLIEHYVKANSKVQFTLEIDLKIE